MIESVKEVLIRWNSEHAERVKLQHAYLVVSLAGIVIAGLIGLLNRDLSQLIVTASLISLAVWLANVLTWALLYSLVIVKFSKKTTRK